MEVNEPTQNNLELTLPDGAVLRGVFRAGIPDARTPSVVFAHGFGSARGGEKALALESECRRRGWAFGACNFRGHGDSDGSMLELSGSRLIEDLETIAGAVAGKSSGPLCLFGSSMGGWVVSWLAALHPERVVACALVAPAFRFLEWRGLSEAERDEWLRTGRLRLHNDWIDLEVGPGLLAEAADYTAEALSERFQTPTVIFHGMSDAVVPYRDSVEFAERCGAADLEVVLVKSGDHRLNLCREEVARRACDFFAARTAPAAPGQALPTNSPV